VGHRWVELRLESREGTLGADLLEAEDVGLPRIDHGRERVELRVEFRLSLGSVVVPDVEQVLDIPRHHSELRHG
jgi:hypothetical protein